MMNQVIYFLCSPSLGIIDSWLPILWEFKHKYPGYRVICIIPKAGMVDLVDDSSTIIKLADSVIDQVFFKSYSGGWLSEARLIDARRKNDIGVIWRIYLSVAQRLEKISFVDPWIRFFNRMLFCFFRGERYVELKDLPALDNSVLLYDVYEETKNYSKEVFTIFVNTQKFSICHGINISIETKKNSFQKEKSSKRNRVIYLYSKEEIPYYRNVFGFLDDDMKVVGIPRHDQHWIDFIFENSQEKFNWSSYIFIVSRTVSDYFPIERKMKAVSDIKKIAMLLGLKVVIKLHPKEKSDGVFEKVFGIENMNKTWMFSNAHPFEIGKNALFAITFYSGVSTDLIRIGVPVIEYLDLRGLVGYDDENATRDDLGRPIWSYRYWKFVFGVDSYEDLEKEVNEIIKNRSEKLKFLEKRYSHCFMLNSACSVITNDIKNYLDKKAY